MKPNRNLETGRWAGPAGEAPHCKNYFKDLDPKVAVHGCITAHNTLRISAREVTVFLAYVRSKPNYQTRIAGGVTRGSPSAAR